ncbi:MAG: BamA/TamA family outer membrane protein [Bacteroidales bacterium]|nr:BamA/TamA family outer membrane protein [Bacteroidales bacterium]
MNSSLRHTLALILIAAGVAACSTTRVLSDGEYRLKSNVVNIEGEEIANREVTPYLRQPAQGWNPFLCVYNWSGKEGTSLISRILRSVGTAPVIYNPDMVESSITGIKNHLTYIGYFNSKVNSRVEVDKKNVTVYYDITPGKSFPISEIQLETTDGEEFNKDFLKDSSNISIKVGDRLSESDLEAESARSAAAMRQLGYYTLTKNNYFFEADTCTNGYTRLKMSVNGYSRKEDPSLAKPVNKYYFGKVSINHPANMAFRPKVLKSINTIKPGTIYSESTVSNTYSRMSALKTFNAVNIGLTPREGQDTVDCEINLSQSKIQGYKIGIEGSSNSSGLIGISPQISYTHKNIFHGGEWLTLGFRGDFQFKVNDRQTRSNEVGVTAGLSFPKFLGLPYSIFKGPSIPRTEINLAYSFQDRPEYMRNLISFQYGYSGNHKGYLFYQIYPLQANIVHLKNIDETFYETLSRNPFLRYAYQDHFDAGESLILYYTTDASANPKKTYRYIRFQTDLSGNVLSLFNGTMKEDEDGHKLIAGVPYSQYIKGEVQVGKTWVIGKNGNMAIATRLLAGAGHAYGNSTTMPFEKQFYSGGANSLRGWQARSIGPGQAEMNDYFIIPSQTGDMKLEANIEYRFNIVWKLAGAAFVDMGNVWTLSREYEEYSENSMFKLSTLPESIAADWGLGLRLDLNFILLRIDAGFKTLDPSKGENRWRGPSKWIKNDGYSVHFGVGYPF